MALKFVEHFLWIASSMAHLGGDTGMWDEEDGFFYDVLRLPDGRAQRLKVRSMVGLLPLCAATVFDGRAAGEVPRARRAVRSGSSSSRPSCCAAIHDPRKPGVAGRRLASILDETKLRRVLAKMLDENEFLSPYGIRSLSRYHADHPYVIHAGGQEYRVSYLPAESDTGMFGGNSNWRGPIWMPVNALIIRALLQYYLYYGDDFTVECPTGSGRQMNLYQVAEEIAPPAGQHLPARTRTAAARSTAARRKFQDDPHWRDLPAVLRVLPRRQRRRARRQPPDRLDRGHRPHSCTCSRRSRPNGRWRAARESYFAASGPAGRRSHRRPVDSVPPRARALEARRAAMNASTRSPSSTPRRSSR